MNWLRKRWEITQDWQFIFPILGTLAILYSTYRLTSLFFKNKNIFLVGLITIVSGYLLMKFFLFLFKKLENKWVVTYKWEMIAIFIVFAITGSTSAFIGKPILKLLGVSKENLNSGLYWFIYVIFGLIIYQVLLVTIGWLFGQFQFFWNFEKKMLKRLGLKRFIKED